MTNLDKAIDWREMWQTRLQKEEEKVLSSTRDFCGLEETSLLKRLRNKWNKACERALF
jgi:hypothetical protein